MRCDEYLYYVCGIYNVKCYFNRKKSQKKKIDAAMAYICITHTKNVKVDCPMFYCLF